MDSIWIQQMTALMRRRLHTKLHTKIKTCIMNFAIPGLILSVIAYMIGLTQLDIGLLGMMYFIIFSCVLSELSDVVDCLLTDKTNKFRALLLTMGCHQSAYMAGIFVWTFIVLSLTMIVPAIMIAEFLISNLSFIKHVAIYVYLIILIPAQISTLPLLFTSIVTSKKFQIIVPLLLWFDVIGLPALVAKLLEGSSESTIDLVAILISISPFQNIRLFLAGQSAIEPNNTKPVVSLTLATSMMISFASTILLLILSYCLNIIIPWQPDMPSKPLFSFNKIRPRYSDGHCILDEDISHNHPEYFEPVREGEREIGIQVKKITKIYNNVPAVDHISFSIYKGETTLLLGHNGAGKTTLMDMILGQTNPTEGSIFINYKSQDSAGLGFCPQDSILDLQINAQEHLELICQIKVNKSRQEYTRHIDKVLNDVGLSEHKYKLPNEMSGGMKRKLSLAMALVGDSKVLILDEPSSGLDPDSRRTVWDVIRSYRADRAVLLSTQHMEEADFLGDRIAIMGSGRIICCGSSSFLNNLFGTGYKLRIECRSKEVPIVLTTLKRFFIDAKVDDEKQQIQNTSLNYNPVDHVFILTDKANIDNAEQKLIDLLVEIESKASSLGIISFSIKSSSIEDVMLKSNKIVNNEDSSIHHIDTESRDSLFDAIVKSCMLASNRINPFYLNHLRAMIDKQIKFIIRNPIQSIFSSILIPILGIYIMLDDSINLELAYTRDTKVRWNVTYFISSLMIVLHFIQAAFHDKATKLKTILMSSRMSIFTYWLSFLLVDLIRLLVPIIALSIFVELKRNQGIFEFSSTIGTLNGHLILISLLLLFGLASMFLSYLLTTQFASESRNIEMNYFLLHIIGPLTQLLFALTTKFNQLQNFLKVCIVSIFPAYAFKFAFDGYAKSSIIDVSETPADNRQLELGALILLLQICVYSSLLMLVEMTRYNWFRKCSISYWWPASNTQRYIVPRDNDVELVKADTRLLVKSPIVNNDYRLIVNDLSIKYTRNFNAVDGLSFFVEKNKCFGLLGVNGAGKTSTFSMIVGETRPDYGSILVCGRPLENCGDARKFKSHIGFDPQQSPGIYLTPREALKLMAQLRDVPTVVATSAIESLLELFDMQQHANKLVFQLSGGNKRKMALAMSLIGNPKLLVLDEPTAGVDPMARRSVWELLLNLRIKNDTAIVISSHAMEECEAICDSIAIMAAGKLRCIGSFQHLRTLYCKGTTIKAQLTVDRAAAAFNNQILETSEQILTSFKQFLTQKFSAQNLKLEDKNVNSITFNLNDSKVPKSQIFKALREFKSKYETIFNYTVNDSSLEDIFISLAKEQHDATTTPSNTTTAFNCQTNSPSIATNIFTDNNANGNIIEL